MSFHGGIGAAIIFGGTIVGGTITGATITGGIFQTATSGKRVVMSSLNQDVILFYSGDGAEVGPASIGADVTAPGGPGYLGLVSPNFGGTGDVALFLTSGLGANNPLLQVSAADLDLAGVIEYALATGILGLIATEIDLTAATVHLGAAAGSAVTAYAGKNVAAAFAGGFKIQSGSSVVTFSASASGTGTATFTPNFSAAPVIVASIIGGSGATGGTIRAGQGATGASSPINCQASGPLTTTWSVYWIAIGT